MNEKDGKRLFLNSLKSKKGQGLSVNAIILIILGLVVLVLLILGFVIGWNKIFPFLSQSNVGQIVSSCSSACSTQSLYDYCSTQRELNDNQGHDLKGVTCNYLALNQTAFGVSACPTISCSTIVLSNTATSNAMAAASCKGKTTQTTVQYFVNPVLYSYQCTANDI